MSAASVNVAGVKLHPRGRTLACDAGTLELRAGDRVVVDDGRETDVGIVAVPTAPRPANGPLPRVLRRAEPRDLGLPRGHRPPYRRGARVRARPAPRPRGCRSRCSAPSSRAAGAPSSTSPRKSASTSASSCASWPPQLHTRDRAAPDRRARRGQDGRRHRLVRPRAVLHDVAARLRAGLDQDGQGPGPGADPDEGLGSVRPAQVLPGLRAGRVRRDAQGTSRSSASAWSRRGRGPRRGVDVLRQRVRVYFDGPTAEVLPATEVASRCARRPQPRPQPSRNPRRPQRPTS